MNTVIHITVRDRVPYINDGESVITHNSDYTISFDFDAEWREDVKTVFFANEDGRYKTIVMRGTSCVVPVLDGTYKHVFIGVQEGEVKTSRPCCLKVLNSIADYTGEAIPEPGEDVYRQIIALLNSIQNPAWENVTDKPFETVGNGLKVENGVLNGASEQVQADWGQNDESSVDYIKNRTHYDTRVENTIDKTFILTSESAEMQKLFDDFGYDDISKLKALHSKLVLADTTGSAYFSMVCTGDFLKDAEMITDVSEDYGATAGSIYRILANGNLTSTQDDESWSGEISTALYLVAKEEVLSNEQAAAYGFTSLGLFLDYQWLLDGSVEEGDTCTITCNVTLETGELKTIDPKYLPEWVQSDWGENDETAKSYVKNRPGGYTKIEPTITGKYTGTELNMGEFTLTVGKEYIVKIDDKEYTATCYRSQTGRYDYSYVLGDYNCSSVPFYLRIDTSNSLNEGQTGDLLAKLSSDITNATITVLENITHQFDIKYIPDIPAEKIFPNPVGAFENIGTISLASATEQTISLSKYDYRIIIGFGKVVASTSPSQLIYNRVYNEPPTGGDLRFSYYTNIAFVAFNIGAGLFSMFLMRYVGSTTTTPERSIGDIFFFPYRTYLSFKDITGNKLPATSISLYGMN